MFEKLGNVLRKTTDKIANAIFLDKNLVDQIVRDLQRALIEADVNILLVKQLSDKIRKAAFDERIKEIEKKEHLIKVLHDELISILGEKKTIELHPVKNRIMFLGLYGAGKTTTISKIGNYYAKRGKKVAAVGLDVHRPAAKEQLVQMCEKAKIKAFVDLEETDALKTWKKFEKDLDKYDVVLVDTAGRHTLDEELISEIKTLAKEIKPTEILLTIQADIGQAAHNQAKEFKEALDITGVVITRMDSSAKAGGALTACAETKAPVVFIGTGEKINDLEEFNPESFLSRLLGMGDLTSLIEKIKSVTDEGKQEELQKKLQEGKLSLEDVIEQVKSMNELGGFEKLKGMIPGFSKVEDKIPQEKLEQQQKKVQKWEHILKSMTKEEKENPEILQDKKTGNSRIKRIAQGAGATTTEVKSLLKQYEMLSSMVKGGMSDIDPSKGMSQKQLQKMMKKFGKGMRF